MVLDLDETLIYCYKTPEHEDAEAGWDTRTHLHDFPVVIDGHLFGHAYIRPGALQFLEWLFAGRPHWDVAVWSAGTRDYVHAIIKELFTRDQRRQLSFVWSADRCEDAFWQGEAGMESAHCLKPLRKVWTLPNLPYTYRNTVVIDDTPLTYSENRENAIPISKFWVEYRTDGTPRTLTLRERNRHRCEWLLIQEHLARLIARSGKGFGQ